ncbi:Protein argonaute-3 [Hypsibius exemplaris]|uniref:Protein argonaute-3 n=1 Tax=Hypsibius exemplaris TaxID=2072580 RepID=A0A1W0WW04_HYPEX|nr:Protein argonaute-3 [Hypsibius exemplaris]
MTGRGIGRGVGRGVPRTETPLGATSPAIPEVHAVGVAPPPLPSPTVESSAVSRVGTGRGRGISMSNLPPLPSPAVLSRQESSVVEPVFPSVAVAVAGVGRGAGRGRGVRQIPAAGDAAIAESPVVVQASSVPPPVTVPLSMHVPPKAIEEQFKNLSLASQQPAAVTATATVPADGAAAPVPEKDPRPTDIPQGEAGVEMERQRRLAEMKIITKPKGTVGSKINLLGNVVHFDADPKAMVYEYRVDFYPQTWSPRLRPKLIEKIQDQLPGVYLFDFDNLFTSTELAREVQDFVVKSPFDPEKEYKLTIRRVMANRANESKELLNLIVKELEIAMKFTQIGRNRYNSAGRVALKQNNFPELEIWPGYQSSVNPYVGGVMLMTDAAFRVIRVGNVKNLLDQWRKTRDYQKLVKDNIIGQTVLTPYNDKSYVVSDITFDKTPADTFDTREGPISYVDYYRKHHNIEIKDMTQPLMFSRPAPTGVRRRDNRIIALIPELCQLTGIQDDLRANFNAMKAITTTTKLSPMQRFDFVMDYLRQFVETDIAKAVMKNWGIKVGTRLIELPGRVLPPETLFFGSRGPVTVPTNGDWTRDATGNRMLGSKPLIDWTFLYMMRDQPTCIAFDRMLREVGSQMGMNVAPPSILPLGVDTNITWVNGIDVAVQTNKSEMVVLVFPSPRDDRYASVKKACYVNHGVASQVINLKTLSKPDRMRAIVQKIALQMNCKLGGHLWRMGKFVVPPRPDDDPMTMMVIGIDSYHDLRRLRPTATAMVASTDEDFTRWHSRCNFQPPKAELGSGLKISFMSALNAYVKANRNLPNTIVIFRDGISDNELDQVVKSELPQILEVCKDPTVIMELLGCSWSGSESSSSKSEADYNPEVYFIIVQKRINQRLFLIEGSKEGKQALANPKPGTVVDEIITRRDMYDFYLVPQNVREGSVTPVHFIVIYQPEKPRLSVDNIQNLAYKLTHMYYNWTGTIRVPAPCMYAHKLAYQSGTCYDNYEPRMSIFLILLRWYEVLQWRREAATVDQMLPVLRFVDSLVLLPQISVEPCSMEPRSVEPCSVGPCSMEPCSVEPRSVEPCSA